MFSLRIELRKPAAFDSHHVGEHALDFREHEDGHAAWDATEMLDAGMELVRPLVLVVEDMSE
jgi:hypothetical protein